MAEVGLDEFLDGLSGTHREAWRRERARTTVTLLVPDDASSVASPGAGPGPLVIKQLNGRYHRADQLLRTLQQLAPVEPPIAPLPVAHGTDPDYVAYEFVPGRLLDDALAEALGRGAPGIAEALSLCRDAGVLLGRFHQVASSPLPEETEHFDPVHFPPLLRVVGLAGTALPPRGDWVRSIADPGPHNVVVEPSGSLRLIDLPGTVQMRPRELDLGMLAQRLGRCARLSAGELPLRRRHRVQLDAADAAVAGYLAVVDVELDEKLLDACVATSAARMARKFWRRSGWRGRPDAAADALWAVTGAIGARRSSTRR